MTDLGQRVLVCDGAMGTMLHAAGAALDRSLPEFNLSDPGLVSTIHESYLSAGADIIQTNTFGANRLWLGDHGFGEKVDEINRAGVRIARAAQEHCEREVLVAGSVSPAVTARQRRRTGSAERAEVIREQVRALTAGRGVDLIILETFGYLDELVEAVSVAASVTDVPLIAQATFADDAHTLGGETPREVAAVLSAMPVAMIGTNCTVGPQRMLVVAEDLVPVIATIGNDYHGINRATANGTWIEAKSEMGQQCAALAELLMGQKNVGELNAGKKFIQHFAVSGDMVPVRR